MTTQEKKEPGFILYKEYALAIMLLQEQEQAQVINAVCSFFVYGDIREPASKNARMVYRQIIESMQVQHDKYIDKCNKNRENIIKRWHKVK